MDLIHILLFPILFLFPLIILLYYRYYYLDNIQDKFFFLWGFLLKIIGAVAAILIYTYYYKGGDISTYQSSGIALADYIRSHPSKLFDVLFESTFYQYADPDFYLYKTKIIYLKDRFTMSIVKIAAVLNIIGFDSFFYSNLLSAYFSFYASWKFYRFISARISLYKWQIGYAIFFMPSVIFWGSGLFKDTYTLAGLYLMIIGAVELIAYRNYRIRFVFYVAIGLFLTINIRSFFLLVSLPFIVVWIVSVRYKQISSATIRMLFIPVFLFILLIGSTFLITSLTSSMKELSLENLQDRSKGFQSWHLSLKGSAYTLGEIEYTPSGIIKKAPAAINVTLFRPFLTEATKPIIFLSFLQSFAFILITLYVILKMRIYNFFFYLFQTPEGLALMGFSLFYAFVVGFTSFNFGALDRYKIPCLSPYILSLIFIYEKYELANNPIRIATKDSI